MTPGRFLCLAQRARVATAVLLLGCAGSDIGTILAAPPTLLSGSEAGTRSRIQRVKVESSSITSIGYGSRNGSLDVEFKSGAVYRYFAVPSNVHLAMMRAASKGKYFQKKVRGRYSFAKLRPPRGRPGAKKTAPSIDGAPKDRQRGSRQAR